MKTVYKYPFDGRGTISVPEGKVVHFGEEENQSLFVWVEVDSELMVKMQTLSIYGTGWEIPQDATHLKTLQSGEFVWHLYRRDT